MNTPTICTIVAKNYIAFARCLTESFIQHHPQGQVFVLLIDEFDGYIAPSLEQFRVVSLREIGIPDINAMICRYTILELSTAVKPFFLEYLFVQKACHKLCYIDPDIYFYQPINKIWQLLDSYGIILIPHLLDFLDDSHKPNEHDILKSGCYNLGFIGLSRHADLERLLHWWQQKLIRQCVVDLEQGLFVDQKWVDLVPGFFESIYIHRDPGCNVAYWNLNHRQLDWEAGQYTINQVPLKFFHFSGYTPDRPTMMSKHQNRFKLTDHPILKQIFAEYNQRLIDHDYRQAKLWPYSYNEGSIRLPDVGHVVFRLHETQNNIWENFNQESYDIFLRDVAAWLNEPVTEQPRLTRLAFGVYQSRADLQRTFPDVFDGDCFAYIRWFLEKAPVEMGVEPFFLEPLQGQELVNSNRAHIQTEFRIMRTSLYRGLVSLLFQLGIGGLVERTLGEKIISPIRNMFVPKAVQLAAIAPSPTQGEISLTSKPEPAKPQGINVIGYLTDETGVGEVARGSLKALNQMGFPATWTLVQSKETRQEDHSTRHLPQHAPYGINLFQVNADQMGVVYRELGNDFFKDRYNIGYWYWELNRFPDEWLDRFQYLNEIWVASQFVQQAIAAVSPIPVINQGAAVTKRPNPQLSRVQLGLPDDKYLFLFTFDMLSFIERKNPYAVIEAYKQAFGCHSTEAQLVIKVTNLEKYPEHQAKLTEAVKAVSGILIDRYLDRETLTGLFYQIDAYVSLHRSEGFGLTIAEAMLLGKPAIATAYSAPTDFMNPTNSYPVDYQLVELEADYGPYKQGEVWAAPNIDQASAYMRRVYEHRDEAAQVGMEAAHTIETMYSHEKIAHKIITRLKTISSW